MSTNDEDGTTEVTTEEVSTDAVADLANAKAEAEAKPAVEETAQVTNTETEEAEEEAKAEPDATLKTEPEHDLDWYKKAYGTSTSEALRLKKENEELKAGKVETPLAPEVLAPPVPDGVMTAEQLYIRGKQIEESDAAFAQVKEKYPALEDKATYDQFVDKSRSLGAFIVQDEKRFPSPKELYESTAVLLGLKPDNSEAIGTAMKSAAASPRTTSGPAAPPTPSKVSEEVIAHELKMYPSKTRQQIIEELEPHIN